MKGFCHYILSRSKEQSYITAPVMVVIEAKNENIVAGLGQCIAAMIAAQIFNQRAEQGIQTLYGAVTTGTNWKFITLCDRLVNIDADEYYINQIDAILGILLQSLQPEPILIS